MHSASENKEEKKVWTNLNNKQNNAKNDQEEKNLKFQSEGRCFTIWLRNPY